MPDAPAKNHFLWCTLVLMAVKYQNIQKENDCKVQLRFVICCTLVIFLSTEGYQIMYYFSGLNSLVSVSCRFFMSRMYIRKTSWEQD